MSYQSVNPNDGKTQKTFEHLNKCEFSAVRRHSFSA